MYHYVPMYLDELCVDISPMKQPFGPYLLWTESFSHQIPFSNTGCISQMFTSDTSYTRNLLTSDSFCILLHKKPVPDHRQKVTPRIFTLTKLLQQQPSTPKILVRQKPLKPIRFYTSHYRDLLHQTHFKQDYTATSTPSLKCLHQKNFTQLKAVKLIATSIVSFTHVTQPPCRGTTSINCSLLKDSKFSGNSSVRRHFALCGFVYLFI